jgi:predicted small integral membrane protein
VAPLQTTVYIGIILWELAAAAILASALVLWIFERTTRKRNPRTLSTIGLLMVVLLFFGGFIDIGGEWFQMWRSVTWNGLDPAFRNTMLALATLVLIRLPAAFIDSDDSGHTLMVVARSPRASRPDTACDRNSVSRVVEIGPMRSLPR